MDVLAVVAGVRLGQVEDQIRWAARETEQAFLALQRVKEGLVPQLLERIEHLLAREFGHPLGLARRRPFRLVLLARRHDRHTKRRGRVVARRLVEDRDLQLPAHFSVNRPRVR